MNFVLGTVLFLVYFYVVSWVFFTPQSDAIATEHEQVVSVESAPEQKEVLVVSKQKDISDIQTPAPTFEPSLDELLGGVEVEKITLRQARKIAKRLGIKQTVTNNGRKKDKPLDWLQREIRQKLQQSPNEVAPVIKQEVLAA